MFKEFFGVPQAVIRRGLLPEMKPTELSLYLALLHESERFCTRELKRTDEAIMKIAGPRPRSLCNARKNLQERGLILCVRGPGGVYTYSLCDPDTGCPWPGDPREPIPYVKKSERGTVPRQEKGEKSSQTRIHSTRRA